MKLSQICQKIELCMREIIHRFEMNCKIYLNISIHISIFMQVLKYLAVENLGDLGLPAKASMCRSLQCGNEATSSLAFSQRPYPRTIQKTEWGGPSDETRKTEVPCHSRCGTIKIPSCSKTLSAEHRPKFCSPSPAMVASPYK
jgi:hypothetical protein